MTAPSTRPQHGERGSLAIEAALVVPVVLGLLVLILVAGRAEQTAGTLQEAARTGARAGSLAPAGRQQSAATAAVNQLLAQSGVHCDGLRVAATVEQLSAEPLPQDVRVDVSCKVPVNDLSPIWVPGALELQGTFRSVIDQYRST
ncbi:pilus assembly protein [Kitasatospora sp. RB6PN24]|uniref:TadE/TadG family type IV pilus assembly protein n=1 Tax=Kitasatospora humi TaxID=2893891 RepID=UPI001E378941|nr:TadE/TadG family type IV pilus assembly protein [Kitasatospora humi]MCC9305599.1 pilus assembly protein [Kitasatospora humi]